MDGGFGNILPRIIAVMRICRAQPQSNRLSRVARHVCSSARGFTLIELMIVVIVVAILAAVAYPSFLNQIRKSRRADAVDAAARIQQAEERWRANNTTYTATIAAGGLNLSATSVGGYYGMAVSAASGTGYTLTATAVAGTSQAADTGCTVMTVTVTNGNAVNTPAICWSR